MNYRLLVSFSFLFLTGCATYQIKPLETEKTVWVKVGSANIRDGPSTANKVIAGAKWNDKLLVREHRAKWYKVKLPDGTIGWIYEPLCSSEKLKAKPIIESDRQQERLFPASQKDGYCDHCGKKLSAWESFYYSTPNMELCKECYKEMEALIEMIDRWANSLLKALNNPAFRATISSPKTSL